MVALKTRALPIGGMTSDGFYENCKLGGQILDIARHLVIPIAVLTFISLAEVQRQMRGNILDVLRAEYVRTARAKGLPENKVIFHHAPAQCRKSAHYYVGLVSLPACSAARHSPKLCLPTPGLGC